MTATATVRPIVERYIVHYRSPNGATAWDVMETIPAYATDKARVMLAEKNATDPRGYHWNITMVERRTIDGRMPA